MESFESTREESEVREHHAEIVETDDPDDARENIRNLIEAGERPTVTIPRKYLDALRRGLQAHSTWIPGLDIIAGTLGRDPYLPNDEDRIIAHIDGIKPEQVEPRFTGPNNMFQGIIVFRGPIPPEQIQVAV